MRKRDLIQRCDDLRVHLTVKGQASEPEIEAVWPTRKNATVSEWWLCYSHLRSYLLRWRFIKPGSEQAESHAETELLKAHRDEPETVELTTGKTVLVFPKSHDVLDWFDEMGWRASWLQGRVTFWRKVINDGDLDHERYPDMITSLETAAKERSAINAAMLWNATYQGPDFPWSLAENGHPWDFDVSDIPRRFFRFSSVNAKRINTAFLAVNLTRLVYAQQLNRSSPDGRHTWSVYYANRAHRTGLQASYLMLKRSQASQLAEDMLANASLEEALGNGRPKPMAGAAA